MSEYHKIQTVWSRDPENNNKTLLEGRWSTPEFEYLRDLEWTFTEKVDGTNVRVIAGLPDGRVEYRGKTDNAMLPPQLSAMLADTFPRGKMSSFFKEVVLYGEGYGPKIQKGGGNYRNDQSFVLFDVRVGQWWLKRSAVEDVAQKLGIECVPVVGSGTLRDMIDLVRGGLISRWGDFVAEGIVARPAVNLFARNGDRVITKVKSKDFVGDR